MNPRASVALCFAFLLACGCDGASSEENGAGAESGSGDDIQWQLTYSGAISGEIEGDVLAVASVSSSTSIAASTSEPDGPLIQANVLLPGGETGEVETVVFTLDLDAQTRCSGTMEAPVVVTVSDGNEDTYTADFEGALECDAGRITIEGYFAAG